MACIYLSGGTKAAFRAKTPVLARLSTKGSFPSWSLTPQDTQGLCLPLSLNQPLQLLCLSVNPQRITPVFNLSFLICEMERRSQKGKYGQLCECVCVPHLSQQPLGVNGKGN